MGNQRRTKHRTEPLTDAELQSLVERYENGEMVAALADETGYTWAGMHAALKRCGVNFHWRKPGPSPRRISADDPRVVKALELRETGMGYVRAAREAGISGEAVRRALVESGRDPQAHWKGEGALNWKGGRQRAYGGYVRVLVDDLTEPMGTNGHVLEHRAVMAHHIGRPLLPDETVHHKNGVKDDNRLGNLELWSSRHAKGQRVADLREFAKEILALYPD